MSTTFYNHLWAFINWFQHFGIFQQSFKTFQQFAKSFQQIIFNFNIASKQFNNHNCSTIDKTFQHFNYFSQQYGKAIQQKHIFWTIWPFYQQTDITVQQSAKYLNLVDFTAGWFSSRSPIYCHYTLRLTKQMD